MSVSDIGSVEAAALAKIGTAAVPDRLLEDVGLKEPAMEREYVVLKRGTAGTWVEVALPRATTRAGALAVAEADGAAVVPGEAPVMLQIVPARFWRAVTRTLDEPAKPRIKTEGL